MRKILTLLSLLVVSAALSAQDAYQSYISTYWEAAVQEMYRSGVPASITLAQGLLESGQGRSTLAKESNNHFGIKCHKDWTGEKVYHDDDAKGECFRKYPSVSDSYKDHSDFLRYKDRYKSLFDLEVTDYKGWATGLKAAGYATDPGYAQKLITIIEKYELYKYDTEEDMVAVEPEVPQKEQDQVVTPQGEPAKADKPAKTEKTAKVEKPAKRTERPRRPESPNSIEALKPADGFAFSLARMVYNRNEVACVMAVEGETYASIASDYDLFPKEILKFNDLKSERPLNPGDIVFIRAKKTQAAKGLDKHICDVDGETLWQLSQRYGVKLANLCKLNGISAAQELHEGDEILLRKKQK